MTKKFELLAPGGDIESIKAAIVAGADAVYCGLSHFNARNRAINIEIGDLNLILHLAHSNQCKVYLTINILIIDNEFRSLVNLLNKLVNTTLDGVIVQDLGLLYLLSTQFKSLEIHASTQLTSHNAGQIVFLGQLGVERINLCRELNIDEVAGLVDIGHKQGISSEVFVHGSYCLGFSGICYFSSVLEGKSGNRGRCSQQCRDQYQVTKQGNRFPLNLKDNSVFKDLNLLAQAGVDALKIEGRMKKYDYVYTVVNSWRQLLNQFYSSGKTQNDDTAIYRVFNRTFTNGFLLGEIDRDMFIDNPRDSSALHFSEKDDLYAARNHIERDVTVKIEKLRAQTLPLSIKLSGAAGERLQIVVRAADNIIHLSSRSYLAANGTIVAGQKKGLHPAISLDRDSLQQHFEFHTDSRYRLGDFDLSELESQVLLSQKELTGIHKKIRSFLNHGTNGVAPVELPRLPRQRHERLKPNLSILISSAEQLAACRDSTATIYFQLPSYLQHNYGKFVDLFREHRQLIPWFPAVLIGADYSAAVQLLRLLRPQQIVTNNMGIGYEAFKMGISWVAGPYLNSINSYTLLCLKEKFNCSGAFISNELSQDQIKMITKPVGFDLYYSLYHPITLLTSRQCLVQRIDGCEKKVVDADCIQNCTRTATITDMKNRSLYIAKSRGNYQCLYHCKHFLNSEIVTDLPHMFTQFLIDLNPIKNETTVQWEPASLIELFERLVTGDPQAREELEVVIQNTSNEPYHRGI
ncbi:putative protease [Desulfuromusa kysingii]|uniref:Putative protease n=1 Tax=Desulfuromusa kysingii TaxID=37625 RepID=A0A1H4CB17_9BACT|nr:peptidase U32 family protein [Desulfuromusa kysingii]SEA57611.1 putative protease [Desulfuromusa kysingii]